MGQENKFLIIIPAFNEEQNIANVITGIKSLSLNLDILVVNDGSFDSTAESANKAGAKVISFPFNLGYGAALQTGYKYCVKHNYPFAVQLDADGQHDIAYIRDLVLALENGPAEVVIGSRFLGGDSYKTSPLRALGIKLYALLVSLVIGRKITDPTSGLRALDIKALRLYCGDVFPSDFPDADMIIFSHLCGLKIKEIPVIMHSSPSYKQHMQSGITILYYLFKMSLSILVTLLRGKPTNTEAKDAF